MIVQADGVRVAYAGRVVLDGFSVALDAADQCAVTGRSGSGKTTLLLVLAGLLAPTAGRIDLRLPPREAIYVPQAPSLVPELTAVQNASVGLRVRGVAPAVAAARAAVELRALGLVDADDALPTELSTGMQQRVALARALAVEPMLLLADEPTGALDRATAARVVDILTARAEAGGTALVVATHDPDVASRFGRRLELERERVP